MNGYPGLLPWLATLLRSSGLVARSSPMILLYDGHLVRRRCATVGRGIRHRVAIAVWRPGRRLRMHVQCLAPISDSLNNQGHWADEARGHLCATKHTKHTKSAKVSENEAMDVIFQSSCSSCPSWLLKLSSVVNARSGECDCQLEANQSPGGRRTRCPSYMGRTDVGLSRPAGRGFLLVRRTSCPSPLCHRWKRNSAPRSDCGLEARPSPTARR
ncbi:MAG: hypothetical protein RLY70_3667 [Planctomycetota bacterium]